MLKSIRDYFSDIKTDLFHGSILLSGSIIAQLISVVAYPVLTRLYTPAQFGDFSVYLSISGILVTAATGRLEYALMIADDDSEAVSILRIALRWCIIFSIVSLAVALIIGIDKSLAAKIPGLYFIPFAVFLTGIIEIFTLYRNRLKQFKNLSKVSVAQNAAATGAKVTMGFASASSLSLIAGSFFGELVTAIMLSWKYINGKIFRLPHHSRALLRKYAAFPKYRMPQAIISTLSSNMPILFLTYYFSSRDAGFYGLIYGITFKISALFTNSFYQVAFRRFTDHHENKLMLFKKYLLLLVSISIVPALTAFLFAGDLVRLFFGPEWVPAASYLRIILPWIFLVFIGSPFWFVPDIFSKQKKAIRYEIFYLIARTTALFTGLFYRNPFVSIVLYASVGCVYHVLMTIWYYNLMKSNQGIS